MTDAELDRAHVTAGSAASPTTSFSATTRRWTKWASTFFKKEKPLGSEAWFDPEADTKQKREWLEQQKAQAGSATAWPEHMYENFFVLGLPPDMGMTQVAEQLCELEHKQRHHDWDGESDHGKDYIQPPQPSLAPQVLFSFPPGSSAPISNEEVAALAFPSGVAPEKLKRTPSLSGLDELIMGRDSDAQQQCFVFMLKVGGNFPLYGCCWYVREMLHRPPYVARQRYRNCKAPFRQCMIAAPRCYCLLSHYPFFELHFRVLKIVLDLERLERLLEYDTEKSQLPMSSFAPAAAHPARSSATSKSSSAADAPLIGTSRRSRTKSHLGVDTADHHGPLASHSSGAAVAAAVRVHIPVVHDRQRYCIECANIIEDMCPFTPGMSPVPGAPVHDHGSQQQVQQSLPEKTSPQQHQQPEQHKSSGPQHVQQEVQPVDQEQVEHNDVGGLQAVHTVAQQQRQQQQMGHQQPIPQHQHQRQQQLLGAPAAQPGVCEVCGKPLGVASNEAAATMYAGMGHAISRESNGSANPGGGQTTDSRQAPDATAGMPAAAVGPLESGVFHHHQQVQQQQQSSVSSFAAAKAWVASTSMDGTPAVSATQQPGFDAVVASGAGFDSAAAATADGSTRASSAGAAGDDRWGNWQSVVAAIRGAASAPMMPPAEGPGGVPADCIPAAGSEPAPLQQESSLVQRMWDVWAPRVSAAATPTDTPRASGLANFLRRGSRTSVSELPLQPEQHVSKSLQQLPQLQQHQEHLPLGQTSQPVQQQGPALHGPPIDQVAATRIAHEWHGLPGSATVTSMTCVVDDPLHAAVAVTPASGVVDRMTAAAGLANPGWAEDPDLRPLRSFKAINSSATSIHSSQPAEAAAQYLSGSLPSSKVQEIAAAERMRGLPDPAVADAEASSAAHAAAAVLNNARDCSTAAGPGSAAAAARAVHRHTPSAASNASSFYSAVEQLELEGTARVTDTSRLQQPTAPLQQVTDGMQQQEQQQVVQALQQLQQEQQHQQELQQHQQNSITHEQLQPQQDPDIPQMPEQNHKPSSARQSSSDADMLVSAFAAIAAAATPFSATANTLVNGPADANSHCEPSAAKEATEETLPRPAASAVNSVVAGVRSIVEAAGGPDVVAAQTDDGISQVVAKGPAQEQHSIEAPSSSSRPEQLQHVEQQQGVMQGQPISRGPSGKRSQLFEEVALRRSGDMSAELCKTISHLVQVDSASLLSAYRSSPVPLPGETYRLMLGDLYRLEFERVLPQPQYTPPGRSRLQHEVLSYAEVECAQQLQLWTVAALCRSLLLENIITVLNAALLEKQIVVFCPNIGTLAAIVLSLVPMLRPFSWQSLMLPVTPTSMMAFLEAPVPFVLGVQYKTPSVMSRCHGLVRVNVYKNAIKNASFPSLPNSRQLLHALAPHYTTLSEAAPLAVERPVHVITPDEEAAASNFLLVLHEYVSQLCGDLRLHTVVNVGMTKRTGVFMKDSLFESVQAKDRPFVKAFVETQMFAVYADGVISDYCES